MSEGLSEADLSRIVVAVESMEASLEVLSRKRSIDREAFVEDSDLQDVVERRFVKLTEASLDIGSVILAHERGSPAESNPKTMRALADEGILSTRTADEMANAARFRNVLVHTYGPVIDQDIVYDAMQDLERYQNFVMEVRSYLDSIGALDR